MDVNGCWSLDSVLRDVQQPNTYSSKMYCLFTKVKRVVQRREIIVA
jgi:hypothetical protein